MQSPIFKNKKILITAGPTREALDPVRYISNHSTGKMGYAITEIFLNQGAQVFLISGPVSIALKHPRLVTVSVQSAAEMYLACCRYFEEVDIAVFAAAVADYRPEWISPRKIKKNEHFFAIKMVKNIDIAHEFGRFKKPGQYSVGFALETHDEVYHAQGKLTGKNFDMVVLNSMKDEKAGFGHDTNKVHIIKKDFSRTGYPLKPKTEVAIDIVHEIAEMTGKKNNNEKNTEMNMYEKIYS